MPTDVAIPTLGESVSEGVIVRWIKGDGDVVRVDEPILELETDKANVELPAATSGVLRIVKQAGATVQVGDVVARIEEQGTPAAPRTPAAAPAQPAAASTTARPAPAASTTASRWSMHGCSGTTARNNGSWRDCATCRRKPPTGRGYSCAPTSVCSPISGWP